MKKKIPLEVLQKIQPLIDKYQDLIIPIMDPSVAFTLKDADPDSDFVFVVDHRNSDGIHTVSYKPSSVSDVRSAKAGLSIDDIVKYFEVWLGILKSYQDTPTIFDDHAQKKYEDYYYQEYKVVSEDAAYAPFNPPQVLYLAGYLERVKEFVEHNADLFSDSKLIDEINQDCDTLAEELPTKPQNRVIKSISSIIAKIVKASVTVMKKFTTTVLPELRQAVLEKTIDVIVDSTATIIS